LGVIPNLASASKKLVSMLRLFLLNTYVDNKDFLRRLIVALAGIAVAFGVVACGGGGSGTGDVAVGSRATSITISGVVTKGIPSAGASVVAFYGSSPRYLFIKPTD
jgi:hypothetical protein